MDAKATKISTKKTVTKNSETHYTLSEILVLHGIDLHKGVALDIGVDKKLDGKSPPYKLYCILAVIAGNNSNQACISLGELAFLFNKTKGTTRTWLNFLEQKGIIERKTPDTYVIHDDYRDNLEA